jgi:hypothetical protein
VAAFALIPGRALADGGPIMPLSQVRAGMDCTGQTVIRGTTISSFGVHIEGVVDVPGEGARILTRVSGPAVAATGIAEGFSGSPVYCRDALGTMRNAGAISATVGDFGNDAGLVTPIQLMLGEPVIPPRDAPQFTGRARPAVGPLTISGMPGALGNVLARAGARVGRTVVTAPSYAPSGFPLAALVAGASVGVSYSTGAVPAGAVGTVTYRDGASVYAFGHELDGAGRRSLMLQDAFVTDVIGNPNGSSYKFAAPGHTEGTLTSDTPNAVIGRVGAPPRQIPVIVTARDLDTGRKMSLRSQVADETDIGLPTGSSLVDLIAPLEAGEAATEIFDGAPAAESGRMCVEVSLRETSRSLSFCNRYVGIGAAGDMGQVPPELASGVINDLTSAFGVIESVQFGALHVTRVSAQIQAMRGLDEATIVSAHGPRTARPGQRVTIHIRVRRYRGAMRTLAFRLRIPAHPHRNVLISLQGPSPPSNHGADSVISGLVTVLSFTSSASDSGPSSVADLRRQFHSVPGFDGVQARIDGGVPEPVYRDPALLITGQAHLVIRVPEPRT